ncbi:TK-TMK, chimeric thymidine and thymidylate kinase [White spot syndrome virus]|uniref:Thymidine kinase n=8 Tax=White spot syndrome virus TaxID=342409 RepID=Q8VAK7_WSSVS|nr:wsv395 [Shrimp white spot syndrome virus]YP_009220601.1 TK-TMK, chimeric thymidine and thymidylate kinase [White spot syndrome virus]AYW76624.1 putative chimeric thymidine and thymidylate kinase [Procambarus clarkii virus]AAL33397.1 wsv395 [Shrimp white spot syndrome virus]AFX59772.1 wsv395 [White spot syndrome virus]ALN66249.1 TK-TMK, chimeric thymidine and thymidylate kinase [White spot syndrome virus]ALN66406.1 TK-TMK, chimeric thymidine and thymidylate kinase [White spot syndrome virus
MQLILSHHLTMAGRVELVTGPMFAGKSTYLKNIYQQENGGNKHCLFVKHSLETRYGCGTGTIVTHAGEVIEGCTTVSSIKELISVLPEVVDVILIDEGQFFTDLVLVNRLADKGKRIVIAALDGTSDQQMFSPIHKLLPYTNSIVKLASKCMICKIDTKEAPFTVRFGNDNDNNVICVGGAEMYAAACRDCYKKINKKKNKGKLVVLEGGDRCGKSTQAKLLLTNKNSPLYGGEYMCFPDRSSHTGKLINDYLTKKIELDDHAAHLLFSANRWEVCSKIKQLLDDGIHVVMDRYYYSGIVFSLARGVDTVEWCSASDEGLPQPDLVLLMLLDVEKCSNRDTFGVERFETNSIQERARALFLDLANKDEKNVWIKVDARGTIEEVQTKIINIVYNIVEE